MYMIKHYAYPLDDRPSFDPDLWEREITGEILTWVSLASTPHEDRQNGTDNMYYPLESDVYDLIFESKEDAE